MQYEKVMSGHIILHMVTAPVPIHSYCWCCVAYLI